MAAVISHRTDRGGRRRGAVRLHRGRRPGGRHGLALVSPRRVSSVVCCVVWRLTRGRRFYLPTLQQSEQIYREPTVQCPPVPPL